MAAQGRLRGSQIHRFMLLGVLKGLAGFQECDECSEVQTLNTDESSRPDKPFGITSWRLTGSYNWGYKSPNMGYTYS